MPRPKVLPANRKRIARACENCRLGKRRCDGAVPCRICSRRGLSRHCSYSSGGQLPHGDQRAQAGEQDDDVALQRATLDGSLNAAADAVRPAPTSRMLLNSKSERVYVNNVSGLSFLHFLKVTLKKQLGPSRFTTEPAGDSILDAADNGDCSTAVAIDPVAKKELVDCYFIATSGVLEIYHRNEVDQYLSQDAVAQQSPDSIQTAALNLIVAIGAQSRISSTADSDIAAAGFNHGRWFAFKEQLENPSVDLIRLFLLMAFYMVGACRRHAAVMHIGIAATAAIMLGLHDTEQYAKLLPPERAKRWRTYRGLLTADIITATLLGRPTVTPTLTAGKPTLHEESLEYPSMESTAGVAIFDLCFAVQTVANEAGQNEKTSTPQARQLTEQLIKWAATWKEVQPVLRPTRQLLSNTTEHASAIGNLHVSCVYYHSLILVTRPSLVDSLIDRILDSPTRSGSCSDQTTKHLSEICIDAAVHMAQTCYDAFAAGFVLNNMCHILRPVLFEAGLVLGFIMAVRIEGASRIEVAFRKARKLLKFLAKTSSLSREFYDILTSLLEAVNIQRNERTRQENSSSQLGVERLLEFDSQGFSEPNELSSRQDLPDVTAATQLDGTLSAEGDTLGDAMNGFDYQTDEWQLFANQVSGFLPFPPDSFSLFLDSF